MTTAVMENEGVNFLWCIATASGEGSDEKDILEMIVKLYTIITDLSFPTRLLRFVRNRKG